MSRVVTNTIRLVASACTVDHSSYVKVTNPENMYTNIDSSTYATIMHNRKSTTMYHAFVSGFNFTSIPSNATVTSFSIKIKGYASGLSSSTTAPALYDLSNGAPSATIISGTTASSNFTSSATTITIPTGSLTWSQITGYGSNFGVGISLKRNKQNTAAYVYVYGIEIEVTYQQTQYEVTITNNAGSVVTVDPTGQQWVEAGENQKISFSTNQGFTVTDNNGEVTLTAEDGRYWYVISNISADHTIVVTPNSSGIGVWVKVNGQWVQGADIKVKYGDRWRSISEVYVFKEGSWIQTENGVKDIFNTQAIFLKG